MESTNKKEIISFYQSGGSKRNYRIVKYKPDGTTLNNSEKEMKSLLEDICNHFNGKEYKNGIRIVFNRLFKIPFDKSELTFLLGQYYKDGNTLLDADGCDAEIIIKRGLFAHKEQDLLNRIQSYLKEKYEIQSKEYS